MTPIPIYLAVEDDLSEWVLRRLLRDRPTPYAVGTVLKKNGSGYLRRNAAAFNNLAKGCPVLLLTDLDKQGCAAELVREWLVNPREENFLLRVAVREVESWLLAPEAGLKQFLGVKSRWTIDDPEQLRDPKAELLKLAARASRRDRKEALSREVAGGGVRQGPAYNSTLVEFVDGSWDPVAAEPFCPSLARLLRALQELEQRRKRLGA